MVVWSYRGIPGLTKRLPRGPKGLSRVPGGEAGGGSLVMRDENVKRSFAGLSVPLAKFIWGTNTKDI